MSANIAKIAKVRRFFLAILNTSYKYRKNNKSNKKYKIQDFEKEAELRRPPKCPQISQKSQK